MRKGCTRKRIDFYDVVQELDKLIGAHTNRPYLLGLLDVVKVVTHIVNAAARRSHDVVETGKIAHEQSLGVGAFGIESAVRHRLSAAGLITRIVDLVPKTLQQLEGCDA